MKLRTIASAVMALAASTTATLAQGFTIPGAVPLSGLITANRTLSADSVYQITGLVHVQPPAILTIPAGTLIYGNNNTSQNAILVTRGAQIVADGTATKPIIFSSPYPQGQRTPGDWAGLALCGNAPVNIASPVLEGGTGDSYGGAVPNDNSGILRYVRVEFPGYAASVNNELNSITLGGVGSGTTVDYVQASYGLDDAFEFFGGTVNPRHLIAFATIDDNFDTDNGFNGTLQFAFGFRDVLRSDAAGQSNGMESDNDATGTANTPQTSSKIANLTEVGPYYDGISTGGTFDNAGLWRRNTRYQLYNSIITGYPRGIKLDGAAIGTLVAGASACPQPATLELKGSVVTGTVAASAAGTGVAAADVTNWLNCATAANATSTVLGFAGLPDVDQADLNNPNPVPAPTSPAVGRGVALPASYAGAVNTTYAGAFDPSVARASQWDAGWSNYDPQNTTYVKHRTGWAMVGVANGTAAVDKNTNYPHGGNAFKYTGSYATDNSMDQGTGYWIKLSDNRTIEQTGATRILPQSITVTNGWNLVSTGSSRYATASATVASAGAAAFGTFFGHNGVSYVPATTLEPGKAYWVKVTGAGSLTFNP